MYQWLQAGGALLLIADHTPALTAFADLTTMLGLVMIDAHAFLKQPFRAPEMFERSAGHLREHGILRGRNESESVIAWRHIRAPRFGVHVNGVRF
jgi:hypothetical protein